ncbi:MAG: TonB-dependent receptor [Tannerella sp.]|jgi:TonB-linked SusC/RagA family outer membrane protein|nr:TonB-dependent receptor [Tannerella sp.]
MQKLHQQVTPFTSNGVPKFVNTMKFLMIFLAIGIVSVSATGANSGDTPPYFVDNQLVDMSDEFQGPVTVTGVITDASTGEPIIGANVIINGTATGVVSDLDGKFVLTVPAGYGAVITVSYVGYASREIKVDSESLNIALSEDSQLINEVIVVGYGTSKVKDLTSSITTIRPEEIMKTPAGQAMQSLQGKVPGMQIISSGTPGKAPTVRIRGIGSYPKKDALNVEWLNNEAPLYVVDGIFYDDIDFLNPSDITSISVLKDASSAAIYGVRAANGVVLIETKSGGYDKKTEITFDSYFGVQNAQNVLKMANAEQFVAMAMESGSSTDIANIGNAMQRYGRSRINPNVPDVNTDWFKEILRPATIQNYSLDIAGGSPKAAYAIGINYFDQQGVLDMKNEYARYNLRSKLDFKATDWLTVGANLIWSQATQYPEENTVWNEAYYAIPILPIYDELNTQAWPKHYASAQDIGYRGGQNPFPTIESYNNRHLIKSLLTNFYADISIIPKMLTFKTTYNQAYKGIEEREVRTPYYVGNAFQRADAELIKRTKTYSDITWDNVLTYQNSFDRHNLTVMAGSSYRDESYSMMQAYGYRFPTDMEQSWYLDQVEEIKTEYVLDGGLRQYGISYFGRVSYNYDNKYLIYGTFRADGSSKYQQKWGYFPTVGLGWVLSEENFLKDNAFIDYLKLRASWGQLGNDKIQASDGALTTSIETGAFNDVLVSGTYVSGVYSSLKWEMTEETNIGVSSAFLGNRLGIEADYYVRDTKNAAIAVSIPAVGGTVLKNVGVIRNSGFELAVNWNDNVTKDFRYSLGVNISTLKNEVRDLYGQPYVDGGSAEFRQRSIVGQPLLAFFGYEVEGVYQNEAEIQADPIARANGLVPGDFKYKNQNGDGEINDDDRVVLGSYFPTMMYGGNLGVGFKAIDLSASIMGQSGNKILNRKRGNYIWTNDTNLDADLAINRWHGEGTSDKYPSSAGLRKGWNQKMSTYFVEDGSFFRVQNIQLGYNILNKNLFGVYLPSVRISLTADRPLTMFKYNGFNPEIPDGIDTQTYPIPATYTIGLNIKF